MRSLFWLNCFLPEELKRKEKVSEALCQHAACVTSLPVFLCISKYHTRHSFRVYDLGVLNVLHIKKKRNKKLNGLGIIPGEGGAFS